MKPWTTVWRIGHKNKLYYHIYNISSSVFVCLIRSRTGGRIRRDFGKINELTVVSDTCHTPYRQQTHNTHAHRNKRHTYTHTKATHRLTGRIVCEVERSSHTIISQSSHPLNSHTHSHYHHDSPFTMADRGTPASVSASLCLVPPSRVVLSEWCP